MSRPPSLICSECGEPLYVGQPMDSRGRAYHAQVGCAVLGRIRSQYGVDTLRRSEKLPRSSRAAAA